MTTSNFQQSDVVVLNTVESYLKTLGTPQDLTPEVKLRLYQNARDYLYSEIAQRVPSIAPKILSADLVVDDQASALFKALYNHSMDPVFIKVLMDYLTAINRDGRNQNACFVTGALLVKFVDKYLTDNATPITNTIKKEEKKKGDKEEAKETVTCLTPDMTKIEHLQEAVKILLGDLANRIAVTCGNLTFGDSLAIAAAVALNSKETLEQIIASDLPVTASVLDVIQNKGEIIKGALLLEKKDFIKLSTNQQKFIESLETWVFDKMNSYASPTQVYNFLLSIYGIKPDTNKYLINIRDCGTNYSNLLQVVRVLTR